MSNGSVKNVFIRALKKYFHLVKRISSFMHYDKHSKCTNNSKQPQECCFLEKIQYISSTSMNGYNYKNTIDATKIVMRHEFYIIEIIFININLQHVSYLGAIYELYCRHKLAGVSTKQHAFKYTNFNL